MRNLLSSQHPEGLPVRSDPGGRLHRVPYHRKQKPLATNLSNGHLNPSPIETRRNLRGRNTGSQLDLGLDLFKTYDATAADDNATTYGNMKIRVVVLRKKDDGKDSDDPPVPLFRGRPETFPGIFFRPS